MTEEQATIGARVRVLYEFADVPAGTEGVIDSDYGSGVIVAWDLKRHPLPKSYKPNSKRPCDGIMADGFAKDTELHYLELVK